MPVNAAVDKRGGHLRMCNLVFSSNGGISSGARTHLYKKLATTKNKKNPLLLINAVEDIFPHFSSLLRDANADPGAFSSLALNSQLPIDRSSPLTHPDKPGLTLLQFHIESFTIINDNQLYPFPGIFNRYFYMTGLRIVGSIQQT